MFFSRGYVANIETESRWNVDPNSSQLLGTTWAKNGAVEIRPLHEPRDGWDKLYKVLLII
jgi:hypothetical protein